MSPQSQQMIELEGVDGPLQAYLALPESAEPRPAIVVIHEIFGLSDHIRDVANRFAAQGYVALAPALFSSPDLRDVLVPAAIGEAMKFMSSLQREKIADREYVRQEMSRLPEGRREIVERTFPLIAGGMPREKFTQDLVRAVEYLSAQSYVQNGKVASIGFCFGGGMSFRLACHAKLAACVVFYGESPDPIDLVQNIAGPVMGIYGADDLRINQNLDRLVKAVVEYKKDFEMKIYPGAGHAFFNDTRPEVCRPQAAQDAWERVLRFYQKNLTIQ